MSDVAELFTLVVVDGHVAARIDRPDWWDEPLIVGRTVDEKGAAHAIRIACAAALWVLNRARQDDEARIATLAEIDADLAIPDLDDVTRQALKNQRAIVERLRPRRWTDAEIAHFVTAERELRAVETGG